MAMSPDGKFIAFTLMQTPATQFVLFETETRRTYVVHAPQEHTDLEDLAWSPDGDELTFVTGAASVFRGNGSMVWRLRPGDASPLVLLARIPYVRRPALSADGNTLASFEGVVLGEPPYEISTRIAFALFERPLGDGRAIRRSRGQVSHPRSLLYDRTGALFIGGMLEPRFVRTLPLPDGRVSRYWGDGDENNRWSWQWRREIDDVFSFRVAPGEMLPVWPTPFPSHGARAGAQGVRPMNDGRVVVFASLNNANTLDWYDERGRPRTPTRQLYYGYLAYDADGVEERLSDAELPENNGRTGGADISEDGLRFAQVISRNLRRGSHPGGELWDNQDTLQVFERGELRFELRVSDLVAGAATLRPTGPYTPVMPVTSTGPHRLESD
jgi:hypothetical protein